MTEVVAEAVKAIILFVVGGGAVSTYIAWRKDRREVPHDTVTALDKMLNQSKKATADALEALERARSTEARASAAEERAKSAEVRAASAERMVHAVTTVVRRHVASIIEWIDGGAVPPPPVIEQELRDMVSELGDADDKEDH